MNGFKENHLKKIEAILFDIDGTLSDTDDQAVMKVAGWLKPLRGLISDKKRQAAARWMVMAVESPGNFFYNLADRLAMDSLLIKLLNRFSQNKKHPIKHFWMIPGVEKMLQKLALKLPLAVVSARDEISSLAFIHQFHLEPYFRVIVTSQSCRHTKPFPDPLLYAAEELQVKPENCLMVGDTTVDIRAAKLAGMQALGVLCGFGTRRELLRAGADFIINSTPDLLDLFGSIT
jgi:HAD superfamily hydrolase (TIGR01549 family)